MRWRRSVQGDGGVSRLGEKKDTENRKMTGAQEVGWCRSQARSQMVVNMLRNMDQLEQRWEGLKGFLNRRVTWSVMCLRKITLPYVIQLQDLAPSFENLSYATLPLSF